MARLKSVLEDNPVLLWGNVEGGYGSRQRRRAFGAGVGVGTANDTAFAQRSRIAEARSKRPRLYTRELHAFCPDGEGLEVNDQLTAENIRQFLSRAEKFVNGMQVPNEAFEKSVPEVFRGLIDEALTVK